MREVASQARGLYFVRDLKGETFPALTPGGGIAGVIAVQKQGRSKRLKVGGEMNGRCRLADPALVAGHSNYHSVPYLYFHTPINLEFWKFRFLCIQKCAPERKDRRWATLKDPVWRARRSGAASLSLASA